MNTRVIAIVAAVILLLGAGGLLFYNKAKSPSTQTPETINSTQETQGNSIFDLFSSGQNQQCSYTYTGDSKGESSGTFYITKDKLRGDITTTTEGKTTMFYMIRNGEDNYMWGSDLQQGIKMRLSLEDLKENEQASSYFDVEKDYDYKCQAWSVDESKFNPPADVKFTDLSGFMQQESTSTTPGSTMKLDVSACASITDAGAKAACEKAVSEQ